MNDACTEEYCNTEREICECSTNNRRCITNRKKKNDACTEEDCKTEREICECSTNNRSCITNGKKIKIGKQKQSKARTQAGGEEKGERPAYEIQSMARNRSNLENSVKNRHQFCEIEN